jgi:L-seryl-tRNA(Ser) seleniumtransferase
MADNPLRRLPPVNAVLDALREVSGQPREALVATVRAELDELRQRLLAGGDADVTPNAVAAAALARLRGEQSPRLRPVLNATGIVLHTNLGRAPLAEEAALAAYEAGRGYLDLELDLESGRRSSRQDAVRDHLVALTGAESATAVNNCAAATFLTLRALAAGREVIVSRGQLIEIGGSFRIPEIMAASGAILREVGTTNITRLTDYEQAAGPQTALFMRVHPSNYRVRGFAEDVPVTDLVGVGRRLGVPVVDDVGSGALVDLTHFGLAGEPVARESVAAGADLVLFSGDKLLGGPQAGIILGRKELVARLERDPLMRTFRLDKMTLAALEATLRLYRRSARPEEVVPALRMLALTPTDLRPRAGRLAAALRDVPGVWSAQVRESHAFAGGGSLPDTPLPGFIAAVRPSDCGAAELARRLRVGDPAVLTRVHDEEVCFDPRTLPPERDPDVVRSVRAALAGADERIR